MQNPLYERQDIIKRRTGYVNPLMDEEIATTQAELIDEPPVTMTPEQMAAKPAAIQPQQFEWQPVTMTPKQMAIKPAAIQPTEFAITTEEVEKTNLINAIKSGDVDSMLTTSFANYQNFFAGVDWTQYGQASIDYLSGLLTGQTPATRAWEAKEAAAMTLGFNNLMNNIAATAAAAGVTGGELQRFYDRGLNKVATMMGDFALENIIRMEQTQERGFQGFMDMLKLSGDVQTKWLSTYMDYKTWQTNENRYLVNLAANDPTAAQYYNILQQGGEITQEQIDYIETHKYDYWSMDDLIADTAYLDEFGIDYTITEATDADGNLIVNSAGEQVWKVTPKSSITFDEDGNAILNIDKTDEEEEDETILINGISEGIITGKSKIWDNISSITGVPLFKDAAGDWHELTYDIYKQERGINNLATPGMHLGANPAADLDLAKIKFYADKGNEIAKADFASLVSAEEEVDTEGKYIKDRGRIRM